MALHGRRWACSPSRDLISRYPSKPSEYEQPPIVEGSRRRSTSAGARTPRMPGPRPEAGAGGEWMSFGGHGGAGMGNGNAKRNGVIAIDFRVKYAAMRIVPIVLKFSHALDMLAVAQFPAPPLRQ